MSHIGLIAGTWTTAGNADAGNLGHDQSPHDIRDRIEISAKAGFNGFGIGYLDLIAAEQKYGTYGIKKMLDDNGMLYFEIEFLDNWFVTDERRKTSDAMRYNMLRAAEEIGARHIKVGGDFAGGDFNPDLMAEEFRKLAGEAENAGTTVVFEPMPVVNVQTPDMALEFITQADHKSGGLMLDIWHIARAGIDFDELKKLPAEWIFNVELNDAPLEFEGDLLSDTFNGRRVPGKGELDVAGYIDAVRATGYDGIYGLEILDKEYRKIPIEDAIPAAYEATIPYLVN